MNINKKLGIAIILFLILISFLTNYYGSTDVGDYSAISKYLSGNYAAKIRSSHSYLYGAIHYPLIKIFNNFMVFKISSVLFLFLIIYSVYLASGKRKESLLLILFSPVVWYMAPWINPIQLSSLLFFWVYFFIKKYESSKNIRFLIFAGFLTGLSWAFWDGMIFFIIFFIICFFYNKKILEFCLFIVFIIAGLLPRLILDQILLGFAFSGILKYIGGFLTSNVYGWIYQDTGSAMPLILFVVLIITIVLLIPFYIYKLFSKDSWNRNKKLIFFISLSLIIILKMAQIRYLLLLVPILVLELAPLLKPSEFKKHLCISIILTLLVFVPYVMQIKYSTNSEEFSSLIINLNNIKINERIDPIIQNDLEQIVKDYPNQVFVVGNKQDDYQILASLYWKNNVKEFVSIQDYNLYLKNTSSIFEKRITFVPRIQDRRQIWIAGGMEKNSNDKTDYKNISLGIGIDSQLNITDFKLINKYNILYLYKK